MSSSAFSTSSTQVILDLNGNSIVADSSAIASWGLEHRGGFFRLFDGKGSGSIGVDVTNCLGSSMMIHGGTFYNVLNMEDGLTTIYNGRFRFPVRNKSDGSIVIYDGTFENSLTNEGSGSIKIYGGRYRDNPRDFLGEGCSLTYDYDQSMWVVTKQ